MPIYCDRDRKLCDTTEPDGEDHAWLPGNEAAHKLFRCVESLRDVHEGLESAEATKNPKKRQRRLKILYTHLHSFAVCVLELLNNCESHPDTVAKMPEGGTKLIARLRTLLLENVPVGKGRLLSVLRDKTSAHIDRSLSAYEARELQKKPQLHEVGLWLDVTICVFSDLLKLPIYFWTCPCKDEGVIRAMMCEPFLLSFRVGSDGQISELLGMHVADSPRNEIKDLVLSTLKRSRWMFKPEHPQIRAIYYDQPRDSWAQSLKNVRVTQAERLNP